MSGLTGSSGRWATAAHMSDEPATRATAAIPPHASVCDMNSRLPRPRWAALIGKLPIGAWELTLPNTEEMKNRFKNEEIDDILLVLTYAGRTPAWPA